MSTLKCYCHCWTICLDELSFPCCAFYFSYYLPYVSLKISGFVAMSISLFVASIWCSVASYGVVNFCVFSFALLSFFVVLLFPAV